MLNLGRLFAFIVLFGSANLCCAQHQVRQSWDLSSANDLAAWSIRPAGTQPWKPVKIPTVNEMELVDGEEIFKGTAEYQLTLDRSTLELPETMEGVWQLDFEASATATTVDYVLPSGERQRLGSHLGGWTPFSIDLSEVLRQTPAGPWEFVIEVDEREGHNTQGFLPIIEPHFGGIWQSVRLTHLPHAHLDSKSLLTVSVGDLEHPAIQVSVKALADDESLLGKADSESWRCVARATPLPLSGQSKVETPSIEQLLQLEMNQTDDEARFHQFQGELSVSADRLWSCQTPYRYAIEVELQQRRDDEWIVVDRVALKTGWRHVETDGTRLLVNGRPIAVRGVLNWGYNTQSLGPTTDLTQIRQELDLIETWGFNLMKFCLWMPTREYLDLADERGVLVWMEYPTWHPQMDAAHREELLREYDEFYHLDGSHPSIVLRSLTCETGHGADVSVLQELYDLGKQRIPGALIEDDSSWIEWHRIHDFYDDHPYGNNHTWPATLERLNSHIATRRPLPLMLGEAIAADTWFIPSDEMARSFPSSLATDDALQNPSSAADQVRTFWHPGFAQANALFQQQELPRYALTAEQVERDSKHYGLLMRKYQIETFRRMQPDGGYVVSVIRDFPLAGMGLFDYHNEPKWLQEDWDWQRDTLLSLVTNHDRRSFPADSSVSIQVIVTHHGPSDLSDLTLKLHCSELTDHKSLEAEILELSVGESRAVTFEIKLPKSDQPQRYEWRAELLSVDRTEINNPITIVHSQNHWSLWALPSRATNELQVQLHRSWNLPLPEGVEGASWNGLVVSSDSKSNLILARTFDRELLEALEQGARVVMLPGSETGAIRTQSHWFLRGAPLVGERMAGLGAPREFWLELQHFDLAGDVIGNWTELDAIEPWLSLWDNHDIKQVKTHPLLFEMPVGGGRVWVSALPAAEPQSAGSWTLRQLIRCAADESVEGQDAERAAANLIRLRNEVGRRELRLDDRAWRFAIDALHQGTQQEWHQSEFDDRGWEELRIDAHWDGQGHPNLDGWAWYRTKVKIPEDWDSATSYLSFTGVDDHYVAYVNGERVGTGGVIETKQTAFEERVSHDISKLIKPGEEITIAVEVYDWYGAGGIFRPVSITTAPLVSGTPWLK